ncbi:hypothetical protein [Prosthecobacter sp.]|uniref:hypothetical protein n=1 Tax=Prosthecobacter sp. TaxID=1965333 RepID=UPI001D570D63|nr:hypothetical protein [Prosthecobacter sp.]MCB1279636.1 SMI1/KNR4 family protein [Prosthecobacter sp.]
MNPEITSYLDSKGCYFRNRPWEVDEALTRLGVTPPREFVEFFRKYEGGFGSRHISFELADIVGHAEELTQTCRDVHGFPNQCVVLSDEVADAVLVYDTLKDEMYDVDFEGSDEKLREGTLEPDWPSFSAFLEFYFLGQGRMSARNIS